MNKIYKILIRRESFLGTASRLKEETLPQTQVLCCRWQIVRF